MDEYESLSRTKWECKYHVVFVPKCRRRTLLGQIRQHLGEVFYKVQAQKRYLHRRVYGERKRNFVGQSFWIRGFFVSTLGRDETVIREYMSALATGKASRIALINGAQGSNVFFRVGSAATLGKTTSFIVDLLALTSITLDNGATISCGATLRAGLFDHLNSISADGVTSLFDFYPHKNGQRGE